MNQIQKLKLHYENDTKEKLSHINQIEDLEKIFERLQKKYLNFTFETSKSITNPMKMTQIKVLTNALMKTNESIIVLLKSQLYIGSDPLARVALEHSINLLYLLDDDTNERSKEFIRNFIDTTLNKSKQWYQHCLKINNEYAIKVSKDKVEMFEQIKKENSKLYNNKKSNWPELYKRFKVCGHEDAYRTLYAMNSDSVHSLAEDVYNFGTVLNFPIELQSVAIKNFKATNISLSIYHGIKTLYYFGLVLVKLSSKLDQDKEKIEIIKLVNSLAPFLVIHGEEVEFEEIN
ncbi:DUF5677 domain-containing protein [Sulfurimonas sp. HSL-1716]|uniref:DUF5677 domain-containing protein n=1 Tax=Hydrocurvibacter sulfurireducens TaxID=3131937 RepID=UPI0031F8FC28